MERGGRRDERALIVKGVIWSVDPISSVLFALPPSPAVCASEEVGHAVMNC